jgi:hypothetical protein
MRLALALLAELDVAAFDRAVATWRAAGARAPDVAAVLNQYDALGEPELALRVTALLFEGATPTRHTTGWSRRWQALGTHVDKYLAGRGSSRAAHFGALGAPGGSALARCASEMAAAS